MFDLTKPTEEEMTSCNLSNYWKMNDNTENLSITFRHKKRL